MEAIDERNVSVMEVFEALVGDLRASGYSVMTILNVGRMFASLDRFTEGGAYTEEAGRAYVESGHADGSPHSRGHQSHKRRVVALVEGYIADGGFDLSPKFAAPSTPTPSSGAMLDCIEGFMESAAAEGLAKGTLRQHRRTAGSFAVFLESRGVESMEGATGDHALGFVSHVRAAESVTDLTKVMSSLRSFLRYLGRDDLIDALKIVKCKHRHGIVEVLSDEDEAAVARACCERMMSSRNAAITLLALTTGLRAGDIANIRVGDVSWDTGVLRVVQGKTGNPVTLPLRPAVLEALGEYLLEERPDTGDDHVFLQAKAPYAPLGKSSVYWATREAFAAAGVDGAGTRLLRHNAATKMLRAGVDMPTIAAVLGHASPNSTDRYLEMDGGGMRACVLPLPEGVR